MSQRVILLVEDDPNDAFFIARALNELGFTGRVQHVTNTFRAREYLTGAGEFRDRESFPLPDIVVSDSTLPGKASGIDFLEWMRQQPELARAPFVILSGEITPEVRARANAAGVKLLLQKGSNFKQMIAALREALKQMPEERRPWLSPD